jgi:hypothetical protein
MAVSTPLQVNLGTAAESVVRNLREMRMVTCMPPLAS